MMFRYRFCFDDVLMCSDIGSVLMMFRYRFCFDDGSDIGSVKVVLDGVVVNPEIYSDLSPGAGSSGSMRSAPGPC